MQKIKTLFKKDPSDLSRVINEIDPENNWVLDEGVKATRKFDGTACAIASDGQLYKRYDVKKGREVPVNAIPCQEPDATTGHWPHWVLCERNNPADKYHFEAFDRLAKDGLLDEGTYELVGPKVQGNPECLSMHYLFRHGVTILEGVVLSFQGLKERLINDDIEGIVFHHPDGRMCKIRKSDFGIKRIAK